MQTTQAIESLENLKSELSSQNVSLQETIDKNSGLIVAIDVALDQLKGILKTQLDELEQIKTSKPII
jgi:hypothetical protein